MNVKNTIDVKNNNRYQVYKAIQRYKITSIPQMAKEIDLSHTAVKNSIKDLINSNLIVHVGSGPSMGGRPPDLFSLNLKDIFTLGIQMTKGRLIAAEVDLSGNILREEKALIKNKSPYEVASTISQVITAIKKSQNLRDGNVFAIGVAILGIVDRKLGSLVYDASFQWERVPFQQILQEKIDFPVSIIEESKAGAIGEREWGKGREFKNFVFLHFTEGIGSGFIENGALSEGTNGSMGEVGHMSINLDGPRCYCGNSGCWELFANTSNLIKNVQKRVRKKNMDLLSVVRLIENQSKPAVEEFDRFCYYHSMGITNIINIFDPQAIIIAGEISILGEKYLNKITDFVSKRALPSHLERCNIQFSRLAEPYQPLLGAASFALENRLLNKDFGKNIASNSQEKMKTA